MKHVTEFMPDDQGTAATEYKLALYAELKRDREVSVDEMPIPVRIISLIDRAFLRAHSGEFK